MTHLPSFNIMCAYTRAMIHQLTAVLVPTLPVSCRELEGEEGRMTGQLWLLRKALEWVIIDR